jgi:hypothetical protein
MFLPLQKNATTIPISNPTKKKKKKKKKTHKKNPPKCLRQIAPSLLKEIMQELDIQYFAELSYY